MVSLEEVELVAYHAAPPEGGLNSLISATCLPVRLCLKRNTYGVEEKKRNVTTTDGENELETYLVSSECRKDMT